MTAAKLTSKPPAESGLTNRVADAYYEARNHGKPADPIVVVGVIEAVGHGEEKGKRHVKFEYLHLELVTDAQEQARIRGLIAEQHDARSGATVLPLGFADRPDAEQRAQLLEAVEDWQVAKYVSDADLNALWRDHFGGEEYGVPELRKASALQLLEFARERGIVEDDESDGPGTAVVDEPPLDEAPRPDGKSKAAGK